MITRRTFSASLATSVLVSSDRSYAATIPNESGYFRIEAESPAKKLMIVFAYIDQPLEVVSHTNYIERGHSKIVFLNSGKKTMVSDGHQRHC
jgi:hypothetical protein